MGEEVGGTASRKKKSKKRSRTRKGGQDTLAPDYGKRLKQAREDKQLSLQKLADDLNEKSSVISKIEKEQFKPGKSLAKQLEEKLDVELYTNPEVADYSQSDNPDSRKATMEDVADVS